MITREPDGVWSTMHETIAAHHDEVFAYFTTPGGLMSWISVAAEVDLRPGGLIVFGWDAKFRSKTTIAILDYDPGGRIVWDWYADHIDLHAPCYWSVKPSVEDGSRVELRQGPFKAAGDSLEALGHEVDFWRWHLCNLRSVLEAKHDMRQVRPL